jgi:molecular chaperone GrpE
MSAPQDGTNEPRPAGPVGAGDPPPPPGTPGREAEEPAVDGEAPPSPDDDRQLGTPSEEGSRPADSSKGGAEQAGDEVEADLDALTAAEQQRDEYLELAKRTQADFENYRKRMAAEVQAAGLRGKAELASQLIGVIDTLEKALEAAGVDSAEGPPPKEPLAEGFFLTYRELLAALARAGVEAFHPAGDTFDPQRHEALQKIAVEGAQAGTVVEVLQKGYSLGDQLIRPARVVVAE